MSHTGNIQKMITSNNKKVKYQLPIGNEQVDMNALIGKEVQLSFTGEIHCIACGRKTNKSFSQGYCYPCFQSLAQCDSCIVKPEQCHYFEGTCREPEWGESHCMQDHYVYLANSSGVKVGITRGTQIPTRWMDQGAVQALPIYKVKNRLISGLVEVVLKNHVADKTYWQRMLKGEPEAIDLVAKRDELFKECGAEIKAIMNQQGKDAITPLTNEKPVDFSYPVDEYPSKVKSFNFDKTRDIDGVLKGIKGQYLILDSGVLNIRKFGGYKITLKV